MVPKCVHVLTNHMARLFQRHCVLFWSNLLIIDINLGSSQMRCTSHWTAYSNGTPTIKEDSSKILIFGRVSLPLANIRDVMDRVSEQIVNYFHIPMYINKMSKIVFFSSDVLSFIFLIKLNFHAWFTLF